MIFESKQNIEFNSYLEQLGEIEIRFPISVTIPKEDLLLLISMCTANTIIGVDPKPFNESDLSELMSKCIQSLEDKGMLLPKDDSLLVSPQIALALHVLSTPDLLIAFNDENLDVSGEKLVLYVKSHNAHELLLSLHQCKDEFHLRLDYSIRRAWKYLFDSFFQANTFHNEDFYDIQKNVFSELPEEQYAVAGGISRFFICKFMIKKTHVSNSVFINNTYHFVEFDELGSAIYKMDNSLLKLERALECYEPNGFTFQKDNLPVFFAKLTEVIINGQC